MYRYSTSVYNIEGSTLSSCLTGARDDTNGTATPYDPSSMPRRASKAYPMLDAQRPTYKSESAGYMVHKNANHDAEILPPPH